NAHNGRRAIAGTLLILVGLGRTGIGALMLQAHRMAGLVRSGLAGIPGVAIAQVDGENKSPDRVARGTAADAADLGIAAVRAAEPGTVAADVDLRNLARVTDGPRVHGADIDVERGIILGNDLPNLRDRIDFSLGQRSAIAIRIKSRDGDI